MRQALELAAAGQGRVEPNPMVGCVIAAAGPDPRIVAQGCHRQFGGPHAEVDALQNAKGEVAGGTVYVTLEPCCHHGKTPPCSQALIEARPARVVVAMADPFAEVNGGGIRALEAAGVAVEVGLLEDEARELNAPYLKLLAQRRPWMIAKWAMTLDGKIATRSGDSQWISGELSRAVVHAIRGRVDAILVGKTTAERDDPLLTARPAGPRQAVRVVADRLASLSSESQLVRTAGEAPVLIACGDQASERDRSRLLAAGCEVFVCQGHDSHQRLANLLDELGRRRLTNVLAEGGGQLLGSLFDLGEIDEVHLFVAPKLIGGRDATSPLSGVGVSAMKDAGRLRGLRSETIGEDVYISGRVEK
ncbi:MAG: bifunctional diaminohydroxyphosphoribosylaminopyrimidine deaminase/5-amino-6-(5-phosphoribosylamino)uracil reductase RibD [Pirellulales bacterium]